MNSNNPQEKCDKITSLREILLNMDAAAEDYGELHDTTCAVNMDENYPDNCDCKNMELIKSFAHEWMERLNAHWVQMSEAHRPHCSPEGNKVLTKMMGKKNRGKAPAPEKSTRTEGGEMPWEEEFEEVWENSLFSSNPEIGLKGKNIKSFVRSQKLLSHQEGYKEGKKEAVELFKNSIKEKINKAGGIGILTHLFEIIDFAEEELKKI